MVQRTRRRLLIGLGAMLFGAGGAVASGAFSFGSAGSLGDDWVQVEGTNQAVSFRLSQTATDAAGSEGTTGGDEEGSSGSTDQSNNQPTDEETGTADEDPAVEAQPESEVESADNGTDEDGGNSDIGGNTGADSQTATTRVQIVSDPNNPANAVNTIDGAQWRGTVITDKSVLGTDKGFFGGLNISDANKNAVSTLGRVDSNGYPGEEVAFLIANVGPQDGGSGATVRVSAEVFAEGSPVTTEQLRFPYRVVDDTGVSVKHGRDFVTANSVALPDNHIIEVVIVIDTQTGSKEIERIDTLRFVAENGIS